jgi:prolyl 4-hydroxylase
LRGKKRRRGWSFSASRRVDDAGWLAAHGVTTRRNFTGTSCELPVAADPVLAAVAERIYATVGLRNELGATLRFRRYAAGEHHPQHHDTHAAGPRLLVATAMLCLTAPEAGGETVFPAATPAPLRLAPQVGRLLFWHNVRADGSDDAAALHASLPVVRGVKATLSAFIHQSGWAAR